jgi:hypothetical protein
VLVSWGCQLDVSRLVPLNSSSKVHCQAHEGGAAGGVVPEHSLDGSGPADVLVVVPGAPAATPRALLDAPARAAVLLVVVLDAAAGMCVARERGPDVVEVVARLAAPGVWLPAFRPEPATVVEVLAPASCVRIEALCVLGAGAGPTRRTRTTISAPSSAPADPRYRHLGFHFDSAIDESSLQETVGQSALVPCVETGRFFTELFGS